MLAYKTAVNNRTRVLITLEIPDDAKTNLNREDIMDKTKAKYRTNKVKVLKIKDVEGNEYETAESAFYGKKITYVKYEVIETDFDDNLEEICTYGIHFFFDREVALLYGLHTIENGLFKKWHDNGQKCIEINFVNGKLHGKYQEWYSNGQKKTEANYVDMKLQGLYQEWHGNGQKWTETNYVDGKLHGEYLQWHDNGQKAIEKNYINERLNGLHQCWYDNGQIRIKASYVNGKRMW